MNIQLELTHKCNLTCEGCNRFCNIENSLGMIRNNYNTLTNSHIDYLMDSIKLHGNIHKLSFIGGEVSLVPRLFLYALEGGLELKKQGFIKRLRVATNGTTSFFQNLPDIYRKQIDIMAVSPPNKKNHHRIFVSPIDMNLDYKRCFIPSKCGISYNVFGFGLGGACSSLCEFFQIHKYYMKEIPKTIYDFYKRGDIEKDLCSRCVYGNNKTYKMKISKYGNEKSEVFKKQVEINKREYKPPPTDWI